MSLDGATNFSHAHKNQYTSKNALHKDSEYVRHVHMTDGTTNNQMQSFTGNTARFREDVTRGLKKMDSAIPTGPNLYHSHVRPYPSLQGNMTSGEMAGIHIEGDNKWKTLIQAAVKQKSDD